MANESVLVVDDSAQNVEFLAEYVLKPNGYQVLVARNGAEGLKIALSQRPDLILLDNNMPRMSGMEVLDALNEHRANIPVIMMTFHGSETLAVQSFRLGVKDYVLKPFQISEMLEAIERALTEARLRRERDELTKRLMKSNQQLEQRLKELNTLFGIGKSVTSLLDQDKLLLRLVEAAVYLINAEEGSLLLVDEKTNELYMVAARGIDERLARSFRLRVEDSLAGEVITSGQPLVLTGADLTKIKTSYLVRSVMYVPLKIHGRVSGVLSVDNRQQQRDFTNHDLRLLSALADYAAISVENAKLFNQAESERAKLATVLSEIEEPVVVIAGRGDRIAVANSAFRRAFDLGAIVAEGRPLAELIQNESLLDLIASAPDIGSSHKREISLEDGRVFYATLTPIPEVGRAVIMQDITYFKELDRLKSDFVSTVSHDLRAPLTSVKAYAQMLEMAGDLNEQQTSFMNRIVKATDHIAALINDLLDLSRIEAGIDLELSALDLDRLATEVVAEFQETAGSKRQQLVYHSPGQPILVVGNGLRLKQVLSNLIGNALKYTPEGGRIQAMTQRSDTQVLLKVEDNGLGIPPADLPFVFDKFYRVKHEDRAEIQGTGLGLAICKSIIEKYGGSIWVESQYQQGSSFTFSLPLAAEASSGQTALNLAELPAPQ
ncbi:MAG: response regulator [Anaerolineales bacterium]|nr:response regulator [Anaerolineales bacterium]